MKRSSTVQPIPEAWLKAVIPILQRGDRKKIEWTFRARIDWTSLGPLEYEAYPVLLNALRTPGILGEPVLGMLDAIDQSACDSWAFLCPHPQGLATPVYAKLGLHQGRVRINLFSLHIDLSGKLEKAIAAYLKSSP